MYAFALDPYASWSVAKSRNSRISRRPLRKQKKSEYEIKSLVYSQTSFGAINEQDNRFLTVEKGSRK